MKRDFMGINENTISRMTLYKLSHLLAPVILSRIRLLQSIEINPEPITIKFLARLSPNF